MAPLLSQCGLLHTAATSQCLHQAAGGPLGPAADQAPPQALADRLQSAAPRAASSDAPDTMARLLALAIAAALITALSLGGGGGGRRPRQPAGAGAARQ